MTLLGYIVLVYAFLGDKFLFDEKFNTQEVCGIATILVLNVALVHK